MNCFIPDELVVERGSESSSVFNNLRSTLPQVPVKIVDDLRFAAHDRSVNQFGAAKRRSSTILTGTRGSVERKLLKTELDSEPRSTTNSSGIKQLIELAKLALLFPAVAR